MSCGSKQFQNKIFNLKKKAELRFNQGWKVDGQGATSIKLAFFPFGNQENSPFSNGNLEMGPI